MVRDLVAADSRGRFVLQGGVEYRVEPFDDGARWPVSTVLDDKDATRELLEEPRRVRPARPFGKVEISGAVPGSQWLVMVVQPGEHVSDNLSERAVRLAKMDFGASIWTGNINVESGDGTQLFDLRRFPGGCKFIVACGGLNGGSTSLKGYLTLRTDADNLTASQQYECGSVNDFVASGSGGGANIGWVELGPGLPAASTDLTLSVPGRWPGLVSANVVAVNVDTDEGFRLELWGFLS